MYCTVILSYIVIKSQVCYVYLQFDEYCIVTRYASKLIYDSCQLYCVYLMSSLVITTIPFNTGRRCPVCSQEIPSFEYQSHLSACVEPRPTIQYNGQCVLM